MGGFGSGRAACRPRQMAEACRSLDVNRLNREGCLAAGYNGGWQWRRDGQPVASIGLSMTEDVLVLDYRVRRNEGTWKDIRQPTRIARTDCRYGGSRPWFICPGIVNGVPCSRRVGRLFSGGDYFLCRHCYGIKYASQSEDPLRRAQRRAGKLSEQIHGRAGQTKPRRWRRTEDRLRERCVAAELEADDLLEQAMARVMMRFRRHSGRGVRDEGGS